MILGDEALIGAVSQASARLTERTCSGSLETRTLGFHPKGPHEYHEEEDEGIKHPSE